MKITTIGSMLMVTRVTGPTHHLLGVELKEKGSDHLPRIESVSLSDPTARAENSEIGEQIRKEVLEGMKTVNQRSGRCFSIERIRYCRDDQPTPGIYRMLAEALFTRVDDPTLETATSLASASVRVGQLNGAAGQCVQEPRNSNP